MKEGKCPKCGSIDVYVGGANAGMYGVNTITVSAFRSATLTHYVCTACGYTESYIADRAALDKIAEKWQRVGA